MGSNRIYESLSSELKDRYNNKLISIKDMISNPNLIFLVTVDDIDNSESERDFVKAFGYANFVNLLRKYPEVFEFVSLSHQFDRVLLDINENETDAESKFKEAIKLYYLSSQISPSLLYRENIKIELPTWMKSLNLEVSTRYDDFNSMMNYNENMIVLDYQQQKFLSLFGIKNIKEFEKETNFFTHSNQDYLNPFNFNTIDSNNYSIMLKNLEIAKFKEILFKKNDNIKFNNSISYQDFKKSFASLLELSNMHKEYAKFDYSFIKGDFRNLNPNIFIDEEAPQILKDAFYGKGINYEYSAITPKLLYQNKEYIPYLLDKKLSSVIKGNFTTNLENTNSEINFIDYYTSKFGNESLLNLFVKYGKITSVLTGFIINENDNELEIENKLKKYIYRQILSKTGESHEYLKNVDDFISEYPDVFLTDDELVNLNEVLQKELVKNFYNGLSFEFIRKYPEVISVLKNKNLDYCFGKKLSPIYGSDNYFKRFSEKEIYNVVDKEVFLNLCAKYGKYLEEVYLDLRNNYIDNDGNIITNADISQHKLEQTVEELIAKKCLSCELNYSPVDAPSFLKDNYPELFLDNDAPEELKNLFYLTRKDKGLTFDLLNSNKQWLTYLKNKNVAVALSKGNLRNKDNMLKYFKLFGEEKGLKLGLQKSKTVEAMINSTDVEKMKYWYDKTGQRFIPEAIVMQTLPLEYADKFLMAGTKWSNLMRIDEFSSNDEGKSAMLKLACSFGVFENDQYGFQELRKLLTTLPKKLPASQEIGLNRVSFVLNNLKNWFNSEKQNVEVNEIVNLLKKEGYDLINSDDIIERIYRKNEDGSYILVMNPQKSSNLTELVRNILEETPNSCILTNEKAHQLFGGFKVEYNKDFRDFLIKNMDEILSNPEYANSISNIQRRFDEIKAYNSNRTLTLDLAVSFVLQNKYDNVEVGNEQVSEVSAIAGYSQEDFDILQEIYNYGKQRIYSSIPKIKNSDEEYTYKMLRLDDPMAMAIGTLTNCCQELHNMAETCMEHSMVSNNGRIFVIQDKLGNIIAQSWVWRNKDVVCFDNIEIPEKVLKKAGYKNSEERINFTDKIYSLYEKAASELIELDRKKYSELLEEGRITMEQYEGLRIGKVTVGSGYNDIYEAIKRNATLDKEAVKPIPFEEPVKLSNPLYTNDSVEQFIIKEREDRKEYDGETLAVHNDLFTEYDDELFDEKKFCAYEKLELVTKKDKNSLVSGFSGYVKKGIVSSLSNAYGLNPLKTKIIINPNLAIIYELNDNVVKIGDLLFNTQVTIGKDKLDISNNVRLQLKLAIEQISRNKKIDSTALDDNQLEMLYSVAELSDKIEFEMGSGYAR